MFVARVFLGFVRKVALIDPWREWVSRRVYEPKKYRLFLSVRRWRQVACCRRVAATALFGQSLIVVIAGCGDGKPQNDAAGLDGGNIDASVTILDAGADRDLDVTDASTTTIRGRVQYEDRPYDENGFTGAIVPRASRGIRIVAIDVEGRKRAETRTDEQGRFSFAYGDIDEPRIKIQAFADADFEGHRARTIDRSVSASVYQIESAFISADEGSEVELLARAGDGKGGAFNIVDVAYSAFRFYSPYVDSAGPLLTYRWQSGMAFSCGSCYSSASDQVSLGGQPEDTDEYDDDIILHELGHYFVFHYGRDTSPGGQHRDRQVEPELAYGEGLAYFFACMIQNTPVVVDTFQDAVRVINIEKLTQNGVSQPDFRGTSDGTQAGNLREEIVAGIMWDAFDSASSAESFDRVTIGVEGQMQILVDYFRDWSLSDQNVRGVDLADYLYALVCIGGVPQDDVVHLAEDRAFPWSPVSCP